MPDDRPGAGARRADRARRRSRRSACTPSPPATTTWVFHDGVGLRGRRARADARAARAGMRGGSLTAPMPATVVDVKVEAGDAVKRGDILIVLEAMKMELPVRAPGDGRVTAVTASPGELVQPETSLIELAPRDLGRCRAWSRHRMTPSRRSSKSGRATACRTRPRRSRRPTRSRSSTRSPPPGHPVDRGVGVRQPEVGAADGRRGGGVRRHRAAARHALHRAGAERRRARARDRRRASTRSPSSPPRRRRSAARTSTSGSTSRSTRYRAVCERARDRGPAGPRATSPPRSAARSRAPSIRPPSRASPRR